MVEGIFVQKGTLAASFAAATAAAPKKSPPSPRAGAGVGAAGDIRANSGRTIGGSLNSSRDRGQGYACSTETGSETVNRPHGGHKSTGGIMDNNGQGGQASPREGSSAAANRPHSGHFSSSAVSGPQGGHFSGGSMDNSQRQGHGSSRRTVSAGVNRPQGGHIYGSKVMDGGQGQTFSRRGGSAAANRPQGGHISGGDMGNRAPGHALSRGAGCAAANRSKGEHLCGVSLNSSQGRGAGLGHASSRGPGYAAPHKPHSGHVFYVSSMGSGGQDQAISGEAARAHPSHLAVTVSPHSDGRNAASASWSAATSSGRLNDSRGGRATNSAASRGADQQQEEGRRGLLESAHDGRSQTASAVGGSSEVRRKGPVGSVAPLNGVGGDNPRPQQASAPLSSTPVQEDRRLAPNTPASRGIQVNAAGSAAAAVGEPIPPVPHHPRGNAREDSKRTGGEDSDARSGSGSSGVYRDPSNVSNSGEGGGGAHSSSALEGSSSLNSPPPFELPEMGAAGEGGRSTKDDPAFMKTFFRNSRLHFIGVG